MPRVPSLPRPSLSRRRPAPRRRVRANLDARRARRDKDVGALLEMLDGEDGTLRAEAAAAFGRIGTPAAALDALLARASTDPLGAVRREATGALGAVRDPDREILAALQAGLQDHHAPVAMYAAQALGRLRHRESIPLLTEAARSRDHALRLYAVEALAAMRDRAAYDALVVAAEDGDRRVGAAAIGGLAHIVTPADDEVLAGVQERMRWARRWRAERLRKQLNERPRVTAG